MGRAWGLGRLAGQQIAAGAAEQLRSGRSAWSPCVPSPLCRERRGVAHTHTLPCLPVVELEWVCFQPEVGGGQALAVQPIHPDVASNAGQARKGEAGGERRGCAARARLSSGVLHAGRHDVNAPAHLQAAAGGFKEQWRPVPLAAGSEPVGRAARRQLRRGVTLQRRRGGGFFRATCAARLLPMGNPHVAGACVGVAAAAAPVSVPPRRGA